MAHPFSCAGVSRRSWSISYHAFRDRGGAAVSQEKTAVAAAGNRDLHLGRLAGESEDRRHRRLCLPRTRMGARPVELNGFRQMRAAFLGPSYAGIAVRRTASMRSPMPRIHAELPSGNTFDV